MIGLRRLGLAIALAAGCAPAAAIDLAASGRFDVQLAHEQSRGRYGESSTTRIDNTSLTLRYRAARWMAQVQIPWVTVRTDAVSGGLPGTVRSGASVEQGLGDIWLSATWEAQEFTREQIGIDLTLKVKTRSGDVDRGLGTGGTDVAAQVAVLQAIGKTVAFGHVGYRRTGDVPGFTPYRDPWYAEMGGFVPLTDRVEAGAYYDYRGPIGRLGPLSELTSYLALRMGERRLQAYVTRGFERASPAWALGLIVRQRF